MATSSAGVDGARTSPPTKLGTRNRHATTDAIDAVPTANAVAYFIHHGDLLTAIIISLFMSMYSEHDLTISSNLASDSTPESSRRES